MSAEAAPQGLVCLRMARPAISRVGNGGWSGWIDEFGYIRYTMKDDRGSIYFRGARVINVTRDQRWIGRQSFYSEHGDWFVIVSAAAAVFGWMLLRVAAPRVAPAADGADLT